MAVREAGAGARTETTGCSAAARWAWCGTVASKARPLAIAPAGAWITTLVTLRTFVTL